MKMTVAAAAALVLCVASASFADITYATASPPFTPFFSGNIGTATNPANIAGAPDAAYLLFSGDGNMGGGSGSGTFTMDVDFPNQGQNDIGLLFFTGHSSFGVTVAITQVVFTSSNSGTNNQATNSVINFTLVFITAASQPNVANMLPTANQANYTTQSNFNFGQISRIQFTFTVTGYTLGKTFEFDAIANPEPGTMALFALGAAGLGGFAWRRRRTRLASRPTI